MTPAPMPTIDDEAAPLPCPFCGRTEGLLVLPPTCTPESPYNPLDRAYPVATCPCGAETGGENWDRTGRSALAAWNRRAPDEAMRARIVAAEAERDAAHEDTVSDRKWIEKQEIAIGELQRRAVQDHEMHHAARAAVEAERDRLTVRVSEYAGENTSLRNDLVQMGMARDDALAERDRLRAALEAISGFHTPSQPMTDEGNELSWVLRHVGTLRRIAHVALAVPS